MPLKVSYIACLLPFSSLFCFTMPARKKMRLTPSLSRIIIIIIIIIIFCTPTSKDLGG